jgi:hypothetical protein
MKSAVCALLLLAALPVQAATYPMAGVWFGTGQPNDKSEMYIDHFNADGGFNNQHRYCRQGRIAAEFRETGRWSVKGNILTVDIATVNGKPDPRTDTYKLLSVDAKTQNYVVLPTNFAYHARRMDPKFEMPSCDLSS